MKQLALQNLHAQLGAKFGEYNGINMPSIYSSISKDYDLVKSGIGIMDHSPRGKLRISGKEHIRFLQGMLSNDVNKLEKGKGLYATLLNVKGKMLADMYVFKEDDYMLIDMEPIINQAVYELLLKYRLSYKAVIENITDEYILLTLMGNGVRRFLGEFLHNKPIDNDDIKISKLQYKESELIITTPKRL